MRISDWSSDVCSSDLIQREALGKAPFHSAEEFLSLGTGGEARAPLPMLICAAAASLAPGVDHVAGAVERVMLPGKLVPRGSHLVMAERGAMRRSEEHTSELQSLMRISYAVFCLKKKNKNKK